MVGDILAINKTYWFDTKIGIAYLYCEESNQCSY